MNPTALKTAVLIFMSEVFAIGNYWRSVINIQEQTIAIGRLCSTDLINIHEQFPLT